MMLVILDKKGELMIVTSDQDHHESLGSDRICGSRRKEDAIQIMVKARQVSMSPTFDEFTSHEAVGVERYVNNRY